MTNVNQTTDTLTERERARQRLCCLVGKLRMRPVDLGKCGNEASIKLVDRYRDYDGEASQRALCSHLRHNYTNYEEILAAGKNCAGADDFYVDVKMYVTCQIIEFYNLDVSPIKAIFGRVTDWNSLPPRYRSARRHPKVIAAEALGLNATPV